MRFFVNQLHIELIVDLDRAGHGAQGEQCGTVFDGGLAVKRPLCVD